MHCRLISPTVNHIRWHSINVTCDDVHIWWTNENAWVAFSAHRIDSKKKWLHKSIFEKQKNDKLHESSGCYCCYCCWYGWWCWYGCLTWNVFVFVLFLVFILILFGTCASSFVAAITTTTPRLPVFSLFSINKINCIFLFLPPHAIHIIYCVHLDKSTLNQIQWKTKTATPTTAIFVFINLPAFAI